MALAAGGGVPMLLRTTSGYSHAPATSSPCGFSPRKPPRTLSTRCGSIPLPGKTTQSHDLYEVLGVQRSADAEHIKRAYRYLQKRCHPDIAGQHEGHLMSILLNNAYSVLSDPLLRSSYDRARAERVEVEGYTGEALYSKWMGHDAEKKAVFVDEGKCVGCLKCALLAPNTFAIETVYGRARAINQWADSLPVIDDAVDACPVDCISWVERSKLPALEFVMSKQPRWPVRINDPSSTGLRVTNVFADADRLLRKVQNMKAAAPSYQASIEEREAVKAVVEMIKANAKEWFDERKPTINSRYYWQEPLGAIQFWNHKQNSKGNKLEGFQKYLTAAKSKEPITVPPRNQSPHVSTKSKQDEVFSDADGRIEYWKPLEITESSPLPNVPMDSKFESKHQKSTKEEHYDVYEDNEILRRFSEKSHPMNEFRKRMQIMYSGVPLAASVGAAISIGLGDASGQANGGLEEHLAGPLAVQIINSFGFRVFLAALVWYVVGIVIASIIEVTLLLFTNTKK